MHYQRSLEIETRLDAALRLIRTGSYSTPALARELGVSIPTVSRNVDALRERGHLIRSVRGENGWHYVLEDNASVGHTQNTNKSRRKSK